MTIPAWSLDLVSIVVLVVWIILGAKRGFIESLAGAVGWIASLVVAYLLSDPLSSLISTQTAAQSRIAVLIIRVIVFIIVYLLLKLLIRAIGKMLNAIAKKLPLINTVNSLLGGAFGAVQGAAVMLVLSMLLRLCVLSFEWTLAVDDTCLFHYIWYLLF